MGINAYAAGIVFPLSLLCYGWTVQNGVFWFVSVRALRRPAYKSLGAVGPAPRVAAKHPQCYTGAVGHVLGLLERARLWILVLYQAMGLQDLRGGPWRYPASRRLRCWRRSRNPASSQWSATEVMETGRRARLSTLLPQHSSFSFPDLMVRSVSSTSSRYNSEIVHMY